jgi:hypothetical protein
MRHSLVSLAALAIVAIRCRLPTRHWNATTNTRNWKGFFLGTHRAGRYIASKRGSVPEYIHSTRVGAAGHKKRQCHDCSGPDDSQRRCFCR